MRLGVWTRRAVGREPLWVDLEADPKIDRDNPPDLKAISDAAKPPAAALPPADGQAQPAAAAAAGGAAPVAKAAAPAPAAAVAAASEWVRGYMGTGNLMEMLSVAPLWSADWASPRRAISCGSVLANPYELSTARTMANSPSGNFRHSKHKLKPWKTSMDQ